MAPTIERISDQEGRTVQEMYVSINAKQKHLGCKKGGANQKQHCKQVGATKTFDIS